MSGMMKGVFTGVILIFIIIMFIIGITPEMETSINSANITNPVTSTLVDMSEWVIPVLAIGGVLVAGAGIFISYKNGKEG